jgi:SNF2 family DNA or RNA helicase
VLSDQQQKVLEGLAKRSRRIEPQEVPDFLDNPEAFLPPGIELTEFSERVKGLQIRVYDSTPYVSVRQEKLKWFPDVRVDLAPSGQEELDGPSSEDQVKSAPALTQEEYLEGARSAREQGKSHFIHDGAVVRFDPKTVDPILELEGKLGGNLRNGIEGPRAYALEIFKNVEALEYSIIEERVEGEDLELEREILNFPTPNSLRATLHEFQEKGYCWLRTLDDRRRGGLLADDMGLGKTVQVIGYLAALRESERSGPALVVAPKTLLENWIEEVRRFCPDLALARYSGGSIKDTPELEQVDIVLTTYDTLRIHQVEMARVDWDAVICDEAQAIKNPTTGRTTAVKALKGRMRIAMTGTPVENGLTELWSIMDWVQPGLLRSRAEFRTDHERPIVTETNPTERAHHIKALQRHILNHYLRRMKSEVLVGLPPKKYHRIESPLTSSQITEYLELVEEAQGGGQGAMLGCLQRLLKLCSSPWNELESYAVGGSKEDLSRCPKLRSTVEILDRVRDRGEKALIFVERLAVQGMLQTVIAKRYGLQADLINGKVTTGRQELVNAFNARSGFQVMILSPKVGGTGLNITSANHVIHYMRPWNPAIENQATDRVHRIGQERDVHVYLPIAVWPDDTEQSVDQVLDELIQSKLDLATDVIIPTAKMSLDKDVLGRVFRKNPTHGDN